MPRAINDTERERRLRRVQELAEQYYSERGAIRETAAAIDETAKAEQETAETVRVAAREVGESAPLTSKRVKKKVRKYTRIQHPTETTAALEEA